MANNNNDTKPVTNSAWIGVIKKEMDDVSSPLGVLRKKPLFCFNALTKNCLQDPQKFQVNLGLFPQNFVVMAGSSTKVKVIHSLFSVNTNPDSDAPSHVIGIHGAAPFKAIIAFGATQALVSPRKPLRPPSSIRECDVPAVVLFQVQVWNSLACSWNHLISNSNLKSTDPCCSTPDHLQAALTLNPAWSSRGGRMLAADWSWLNSELFLFLLVCQSPLQSPANAHRGRHQRTPKILFPSVAEATQPGDTPRCVAC